MEGKVQTSHHRFNMLCMGFVLLHPSLSVALQNHKELASTLLNPKTDEEAGMHATPDLHSCNPQPMGPLPVTMSPQL